MAKQTRKPAKPMSIRKRKMDYVMLTRPGIKVCGRFERNVKYKVGVDLTEQEAHHLVNVEGFTPIYAED